MISDGHANLMELPSCDFCGGDRAKLLFFAVDLQYQDVPAGVRCGIVRCDSCGHFFLRPRVQERFIGAFYPREEYYTNRQEPRPSQRLKDMVARTVAEIYLDYPTKVETGVSGSSRFLTRLLSRIAFRIFPFRYRRILPYMPGGRLLDFGFGSGEFLRQMKGFGWECWGVELNPTQVQAMNSEGIRAFVDVRDTEIPTGYFDWITTYHSVEHFYSPGALFQKLFDLLKPGGNLYVGVPNFDSIWARLFRSRWYDLSVPIHPHVFTRKMAEDYLHRCGFVEVKVRCWSLSSAILGSTQNFLNVILGAIFGRKFTSMWLRDFLPLRILVTPLIWAADAFGAGDRIEIVARKPAAPV